MSRDPGAEVRDAAGAGRTLRAQAKWIVLALSGLLVLTVGFIVWAGGMLVHDGPKTPTPVVPPITVIVPTPTTTATTASPTPANRPRSTAPVTSPARTPATAPSSTPPATAAPAPPQTPTTTTTAPCPVSVLGRCVLP